MICAQDLQTVSAGADTAKIDVVLGQAGKF
jgi:hypothetical protein